MISLKFLLVLFILGVTAFLALSSYTDWEQTGIVILIGGTLAILVGFALGIDNSDLGLSNSKNVLVEVVDVKGNYMLLNDNEAYKIDENAVECLFLKEGDEALIEIGSDNTIKSCQTFKD